MLVVNSNCHFHCDSKCILEKDCVSVNLPQSKIDCIFIPYFERFLDVPSFLFHVDMFS